MSNTNDWGDEMDIDATMEDAIEAIKAEAREEGYQQGYLDALNDIELSRWGDETQQRRIYARCKELRKMVLSK